MIELNLAALKNYIRAIIDEMGSEYVYVGPNGAKAPYCGCYYTHGVRRDDGTVERLPGCIIGRVMLKAGISIDALGKYEGDSEGLVNKLTEMGLLSVDAETRVAMKIAQLMQDTGAPYGSVGAVLSHLKSAMSILDK